MQCSVTNIWPVHRLPTSGLTWGGKEGVRWLRYTRGLEIGIVAKHGRRCHTVRGRPSINVKRQLYLEDIWVLYPRGVCSRRRVRLRLVAGHATIRPLVMENEPPICCCLTALIRCRIFCCCFPSQSRECSITRQPPTCARCKNGLWFAGRPGGSWILAGGIIRTPPRGRLLAGITASPSSRAPH